MIELEDREDVAVVRLAHGKASALDLEFLREIQTVVKTVAASDAKACVLIGSGSIFSAGST